jgi:hypothetical protein
MNIALMSGMFAEPTAHVLQHGAENLAHTLEDIVV